MTTPTQAGDLPKSVDWFYAKNGQRFGPFGEEQFRQMARSGLLSGDDMVMNSAASRWVTAATVDGLFTAAPAAATAAVPANTPPPPVREQLSRSALPSRGQGGPESSPGRTGGSSPSFTDRAAWWALRSCLSIVGSVVALTTLCTIAAQTKIENSTAANVGVVLICVVMGLSFVTFALAGVAWLAGSVLRDLLGVGRAVPELGGAFPLQAGEPRGGDDKGCRPGDARLGTAAVIGVALWLLGDAAVLNVPLMQLVAGCIFILSAWRMLATGSFPSPVGKAYRHPVWYRVCGVVVGAIGVALVASRGSDLLRGGPLGFERYDELSYGPGETLRYCEDLRTEAERLGKTLREIGYFNASGPKGVQLDRERETWVVRWFWPSPAIDSGDRREVVSRWVSVHLAALAFPGEPMDLCLCDEGRREKARFPVRGAGRVAVNARVWVYFTGGVRAEAERLAADFRGKVDDKEDRVYVLARRGSSWVVNFLHLNPDSLTADVRRRLGDEARDVSTRVFQSQPVEIEVLDRTFRPVASVGSRD